MKLLRRICLLLLLVLPSSTQAAPLNESVYKAALASAAAYDDKLSRFASLRLEQQGWQISYFSRETDLIDAQFLLAAKPVPGAGDSRTEYILAFRGTEKSIKDIITDLAAELIFFLPSPTRLVSATLDDREIAAQVLVHRGFQEYAETALDVHVSADGPSLIEALKTADATVLITGHSLGGAAATVFGAMLLERGVPPERLQVISFGAPPVGNLGFSERYGPRLKLTRVVNPYDMVAHLTAPAPDGAKRLPDYTEYLNYVHFGEQLVNPVSLQDELRQHPIRIYVDYAARPWLDDKDMALRSQTVVTVSNQSRFKGGHAPYMDLAVRDILLDFLAVRTKAQAGLPADCRFEVNIAGTQRESASDGWVSVSVIARRLSDNTYIWSASHHVSLMGEMSPLAGTMLATDRLVRQFPVKQLQPYQLKPILPPLQI